MTKPNVLNIPSAIAEWTAKFCPRLMPDDAIFALVKTNLRGLEDALDASYARVVGELALYRASARILPNGGGEDVDEALRAADETCNEIRRDVNIARLRATEAIRKVEAAYQQSIALRYFVLGMLASLLLVLCGVGARILTRWWQL
jgi:hypothetical protein